MKTQQIKQEILKNTSVQREFEKLLELVIRETERKIKTGELSCHQN